MLLQILLTLLFSFIFFFLPSSGISPCGWTDWAVVLPPTLGAALLCSSWAGSDMWPDPEFWSPLYSSTGWGNLCLVRAVNKFCTVNTFHAVNTLHGLQPCIYKTNTPYILKRDLIGTRRGSNPGPPGKKPPLCHLSHHISVLFFVDEMLNWPIKNVQSQSAYWACTVFK